LAVVGGLPGRDSARLPLPWKPRRQRTCSPFTTGRVRSRTAGSLLLADKNYISGALDDYLQPQPARLGVHA
jgi:hypothetical protein